MVEGRTGSENDVKEGLTEPSRRRQVGSRLLVLQATLRVLTRFVELQ